MDSTYVIARDRSMNDYDANMSEKDKAKKRAQLGERWWENEPKTAYTMMSASPMQYKVASEKF